MLRNLFLALVVLFNIFIVNINPIHCEPLLVNDYGVYDYMHQQLTISQRTTDDVDFYKVEIYNIVNYQSLSAIYTLINSEETTDGNVTFNNITDGMYRVIISKSVNEMISPLYTRDYLIKAVPPKYMIGQNPPATSAKIKTNFILKEYNTIDPWFEFGESVTLYPTTQTSESKFIEHQNQTIYRIFTNEYSTTINGIVTNDMDMSLQFITYIVIPDDPIQNTIE